ncbi:MAG TPA: hypothetical protein VIQ80_00980 [Candidatus Saccharimonadales bacterium]
MSIEKLPLTPEKEHNPAELEKARLERHEALREHHERAGEMSPEHDAEKARQEALERANSAERHEQEHRPLSPAERRNERVISQKDRDASFTATMQEVRMHMSGPSRTFSKVIHNKAIERASDAVGNTIARPNAILSGSILAFIVMTTVYFIAKQLGYTLSGFETIGAFALGWLLGIAYDFLKVMVTGRK